MGDFFYTFDDFQKIIEKMDKFFLESFDKERELLLLKEDEIAKADDSTNKFIADSIAKNKKQFVDFKEQVVDLKRQIESLNFSFDYKYKGSPTVPQTFEQCLSLIKESSAKLKSQCADLNSYNFEKTKFQYSFDGEKATINGQEYNAPDFPKIDLTSFDTDSNYKKLVIGIYATISELLKYLESAINYLGSENYRKQVEGRARQVSLNYTSEFIQNTDEKISNNFNQASDYYFKELLPIFKASKDNLEDYQTVDTLSIPYEFNNKINIGATTIPVNNYSTYQKFIEKIDSEKFISNSMKFPFYLDLTKNGNILINTRENDETIVNFVHQLIMQFVSTVPYRKINLALVDVDDFDSFDFSMDYNNGYLQKNELLVNGGPAVDESSFKDMVNSLVNKINKIKSEKLSPNYCKNVFQYNEISPQNTQELHLFVFVNCPKFMDKEIATKILNLAFNSTTVGIYSILVNNIGYKDFDDYYTQEDHKDFINKYSQKALVFDYNGIFFHTNKEFVPNQCFKADDLEAFFKKCQQGFASESGRNIIYLKDLVKEKAVTVPCSKEFKVPIGKKAGDTVYFRLNGKDNGMGSAIIAGGTGSGKSSLLHSIILSGAYTYSPDELEYYLIDFKQGNEFEFYSKKEDGIYIPHVSFLSANNVLEDAYDLLRKIKSEDYKRRECFKKVGAGDFEAYQNCSAVKEGKMPSFKRIVVVIDEYQNFLDESDTNAIFLSRKCMDLLTDLLRTIRNVGISLILASQNIKLDHEAFGLIGNRYMLDCDALDLQKAFSNFNADTMLFDLKKEKGLVYRTEDQGASKDLIKFAYSGETNKALQKELAAMINEKYPGKGKDIIKSGDDSIVPITKFDTNVFTDENKKNIDCYFGLSALSGDPVSISYNYADFCNYVIVGPFSKVRNIEASLGLSFLLSCKKKGFTSKEPLVSYLDLNTKAAAKENPSPFLQYQKEFDGIVKYSYHKDCLDEINCVYEEYKERKSQSESSASLVIHAPLLLIVNSFSVVREFDPSLSSDATFSQSMSFDDMANDLLSDNASVLSVEDNMSPEEKIKILYKDGCFYNIYVVLEDMRLSMLNGDDNFIDTTKVICCDIRETENCHISESGETYVLKAMNPSYVVLYPNVSKVRPFIFQYNAEEKSFINKLKEEVK